MTQQIIDIGANPNDGTGEPLRNAFEAVNSNFTEIYTAGPVGSNVQIANNTITTTTTNTNLVLKPNGIGVIQANASILPNVSNVHDIGSNSLRFDTIYAGYFVGNGSLLTGISGGSGGNGTAIVNGTSNVNIATANGNVTIGVSGTGNVVTVSQTSLFVNGVIATPRTLSANIAVQENVSAMMVSPLTIPNGLQITVPDSSTFNVVP
jgi:hypothetical protein